MLVFYYLASDGVLFFSFPYDSVVQMGALSAGHLRELRYEKSTQTPELEPQSTARGSGWLTETGDVGVTERAKHPH